MVLRARFTLLFSALTILGARAELPSFQETPWLGTFAYNHGKVVQIKIAADGFVTVNPLDKKGEVKPYLRIPFRPQIRQTLPNGKVRLLKIKPGSLKADNGITDKLRKVTITGEAGRGATFQFTVEAKRDVLGLTGKITGTGKEVNVPILFHFQSRLGHFYGRLLGRLDNDQKKFDAIVGKDWFELKRLDRKKAKRHLTDIWDEKSDEEINGPGGSMVEVQAGIIDKNKRKLVFEAKGASKFIISKKTTGPFHQGYFVDWVVDQTGDPKDKRGEAKLLFEIDEL